MISSGPGKLHLNYQSYRPIAISHHHDKSLYIKIKHRTNQKIEKKKSHLSILKANKRTIMVTTVLIILSVTKCIKA